MSKVNVFVHKTNLEQHIAKSVSDCLRRHTDKSVLLLVSGGSSLRVLDCLDSTVLGKHITVSLVDDRFARDPEVSNFIQLSRTEFYKGAKNLGVSFISSLPKKGEPLEGASDRWERSLRQWTSVCPSNRAVVAIMGIGLDGHIAGVMPFPEDINRFTSLFIKETRWIVGYDAGNKNQYPIRMTASIFFLQTMVDYAFMYVGGESKRGILNKVAGSNNMEEYPASVIHFMKDVELHTDVDVNLAFSITVS